MPNNPQNQQGQRQDPSREQRDKSQAERKPEGQTDGSTTDRSSKE